MGGGSDLQRLSGGENCVLGPRRGVPSALHKLMPGDDAAVLATSRARMILREAQI